MVMWDEAVRQLTLGFGGRGRAWVYPSGLKVYVRTTQRVVGGALRSTLDIGTVEADVAGCGTFRKWLPEFEAIAKDLGRVVYVENVLTERFRQFWLNRGYMPTDSAPNCYWRHIEA